MILLTILAFPKAKLDKKTFGGAYVNCWINSSDIEFAKKTALEVLHKNQWEEKEITNIRIYKSSKNISSKDAKFFKQALQEEYCLVYHAWPFDAKDSDTVYED